MGVWLAEPVAPRVPARQARVSFDPEMVSVDTDSRKRGGGQEEVPPKTVNAASFNGAAQTPGRTVMGRLRPRA